MKICVLGCGLRTPLLLHGLIHSGLRIQETALYDIDISRATDMAQLGQHLALDSTMTVRAESTLEAAIAGSSFVISSIRVGNMERRALDEALALECGFTGQETTGPAGFAMALRTIPVSLSHARLVERLAPSAWYINFTNPAGIITQAVSSHTGVRVIGICDTPTQLIFDISRVLGEAPVDVHCEYFGLNHLGWIRSVRVKGEEILPRLMSDDNLLQHLYPASLFPPPLIRALGMIPAEYLFFYYNHVLARDNQKRTGATRGAELDSLNRQVIAQLEEHIRGGAPEKALHEYRLYLNRRNGSYLRLEADAHSAFEQPPDAEWDPFQGETGYHRIAVDTLRALSSPSPHSLILNVANRGSIEGLADQDIVEVRCMVDRAGPRPLAVGKLPRSVEGLVLSMKQSERLTIKAAMEQDWDSAVLALTTNPLVGDWNAAGNFMERLRRSDPLHFSGFERS